MESREKEILKAVIGMTPNQKRYFFKTLTEKKELTVEQAKMKTYEDIVEGSSKQKLKSKEKASKADSSKKVTTFIRKSQ
jgi:hypothetical protein